MMSNICSSFIYVNVKFKAVQKPFNALDLSELGITELLV